MRDRDENSNVGNPSEEPTQDTDADAILTRRNFLIKAALVSAGLSMAAGAACDDEKPGGDTSTVEDTGPEACLSPEDMYDAQQPEACLSVINDTGDVSDERDIPDADDISDTEPQVCLSDTVNEDWPEACLSPPLDTNEDTMPEVCLSPPPDEDTSDA